MRPFLAYVFDVFTLTATFGLISFAWSLCP